MDRPTGDPVPDWKSAELPRRAEIAGDRVSLEPLSASHVEDLWKVFTGDEGMWTYMGYGPFLARNELESLVERWEECEDPRFYVFCQGGAAVGWGAYLRIDPANGSIEIGHLSLSGRIRRTAASTEAIYLLMRQAFALGYRRVEWKCDALNAPSRAAAKRLGFSFEGIFRHHMIYKGRNRDTAWYSIIAPEWPAIEERVERWLDSSNFDADGRQVVSLSAIF